MKPFLIFPLNLIFKWYEKRASYKKPVRDGIFIGTISAAPLLLIIILAIIVFRIPSRILKTDENQQIVAENNLPTPQIIITNPSPTQFITPTMIKKATNTPEPIYTPEITENFSNEESGEAALITPTAEQNSLNLPTATPTRFVTLSEADKQKIINSSQCGVTTQYNQKIQPYDGFFIDITETPGLYKFKTEEQEILIFLAGVKPIEKNNSLYLSYEVFLRESLASVPTIFFPEGTTFINGQEVIFGYLYDKKLTMSVNEYLLLKKWAEINKTVGNVCNQWFLSIK